MFTPKANSKQKRAKNANVFLDWPDRKSVADFGLHSSSKISLTMRFSLKNTRISSTQIPNLIGNIT